MTAALYLTMALTGAHDCPVGYPAYSYSYAIPSYSGRGYSVTGPMVYGAPRTYGYGSPAPGMMSPGYGMQQYGAGATPAPPGAQGGRVVYMTNRARFEPAQITINVGETVEWRNMSREAHTVTADPNLAANPAHVVLPQGAQPIHSGEIRPGGRYSYTFRAPGIYYYVCLPHEEMGMVGIVVVRQGAGGPQGPQGGRSSGRGGGY